MKDVNYPHFIPDIPHGDDCFEGRSQERLSNIICDYIKRIDREILNKEEICKYNNNDKRDLLVPSRIIGLEGSWGSGKSNVVHMIKQQLHEDGYYTYTYDAWGHQEDLQRRSILENLTDELINNKVLSGEVDIQMRNGKPHHDTWLNQFSFLLSNKKTSIRKSTSQLTGSAICGMLIAFLYFVWSLFSEHLIFNSNDFNNYGWIDFVFIMCVAGIVIPYLIYCWRFKKYSFSELFRIVNYKNNDLIEEEFTSSEEPSVKEFKNWMQSVSNYLENGNKKNKYKSLIIVFDNMDRLPSSKVMTLWSTIYTFFSDGGYNRIWTIIPYDYKHLCQAIYGSVESNNLYDEKKERINQFISKTFPITYHVPIPVITDYRKLFYTYFDEAFGPDVQDREKICQVFIHLNEQPNPRNVIYFINELVAMNLQWSGSSYRLLNQALYILKKDFLFYNKKERLDTQLLSNELFDKVAPFYPDKQDVREELCQYAYGLEDKELASELPLRNELNRLILSGNSISKYIGQNNFIPVLDQVLWDIDLSTLDSAVRSLASIDENSLDEKSKARILEKWDIFANIKLGYKYEKHRFDITIATIFKHASESSVIKLADSFIKSMQNLSVVDGVSYFESLNELRKQLKSLNVCFDDSNVYKPVECEPEQFVNYVSAARDLYNIYKLNTDSNSLNNFLFDEINKGNDNISNVINLIIDDNNYDFSSLRNKLSTSLDHTETKQKICVASYVYRILSKEKEKITPLFSQTEVSSYLNNEQFDWKVKLPLGIEDVISTSLLNKVDLNDIPDELLQRICECFENYIDYTFLLQHPGKERSAFYKLNIYCIENQYGETLDLKYVATNVHELITTFKLEPSVVLDHFSQWPEIDWGEFDSNNVYLKNVRSYVDQRLFNLFLKNPGRFSNSIIRLGVEALRIQQKGFLVKKQNNSLTIDSYWKNFIEIFLGTEYLKTASVLLTGECLTMLDWKLSNDEIKDPVLLDKLLDYSDDSSLRKYLHDVMNSIFTSKNIKISSFKYFGKLVPRLGSSMEENTARGLINHFIDPVYKDAECAKIIIENKEFYFEVMQRDMISSSKIFKEMASLEYYSDVWDYLKEIDIDE